MDLPVTEWVRDRHLFDINTRVCGLEIECSFVPSPLLTILRCLTRILQARRQRRQSLRDSFIGLSGWDQAGTPTSCQSRDAPPVLGSALRA